MRDPWIRAHFGPETSPRAGLLDELADDLAAIWQADTPEPTRVQTRIQPRRDTTPARARRPDPQPLVRRELAPTNPGARWRRPAAIATAAQVITGLTALALANRNDTPTSAATPTLASLQTGSAQTTPPAANDTTVTTEPIVTTPIADMATQPPIDGGPQLGSTLFSPACTEIAPTTKYTMTGPSFDDLEPLPATPTLDITLPIAADTGHAPDVLVAPFPGGFLIWANAINAAALADGDYRDTMISAIGNDGTIWWRHCYAERVDLRVSAKTGTVAAQIVVNPSLDQTKARSLSITDGTIGDTVPMYDISDLQQLQRRSYVSPGIDATYRFLPQPSAPDGYATLVATDPAGKELWRNDTLTATFVSFAPFDTSSYTYFAGDRVLAFSCTKPDPWPDDPSHPDSEAPSCGLGITAVDPNTGEIIWQRRGSRLVPFMSDRYLVVDDGDQFVMISLQTGQDVSGHTWPKEAFAYPYEGLDGDYLWTARSGGIVVHVDGAKVTVWFPASAGLPSRTVDLR